MENPVSAAAEEEMGDSTGNNSTVLAWCAGGGGGSDGLPHSDSALEMSTASTSPSLTWEPRMSSVWGTLRGSS